MAKLRPTPAALCAFCALFLFAPQVRAQDALPFAKSYTVTGNYAVGGVDVRALSRVNGFVTGTHRRRDLFYQRSLIAQRAKE